MITIGEEMRKKKTEKKKTDKMGVWQGNLRNQKQCVVGMGSVRYGLCVRVYNPEQA